jgi:hypothetical protein
MHRESFPHLSDPQFEALTKLCYILDEEGVNALVQSSAEHQNERISQYLAYESALVTAVQGAM